MKKAIPALLLLAVLAFASDALANKTAVTISAPVSVEAGTEVTIALSVSHKGNSAMHFTNWVVVKADGDFNFLEGRGVDFLQGGGLQTASCKLQTGNNQPYHQKPIKRFHIESPFQQW